MSTEKAAAAKRSTKKAAAEHGAPPETAAPKGKAKQAKAASAPLDVQAKPKRTQKTPAVGPDVALMGATAGGPAVAPKAPKTRKSTAEEAVQKVKKAKKAAKAEQEPVDRPVGTQVVETPSVPSLEERQRLIASAAYLRAESRGFAPGGDVQDWLDAEAEINARWG